MTTKSLEDIAGKFGSLKVLVIGDVIIDHYVRGSVVRLNPEAPVPLLDVDKVWDTTGGAGNAAKNLAALGAKTILVTVTGHDPGAFRLRELAEKENYKSVTIRDASRPTIVKSRYMAGGHQLLRVDEEEKHEVAGEIEREIISAIENGSTNVDAILVSDYAKGVVTKNVAKTIIDVAAKHKIPVVVDTKASHTDLFTGVTAITPNKKEAHEFLELDYLDDKREPKELAELLRKKMQSDVFVTLSGDGIYMLSQAGESSHVKQEHKVEVSDVSGAGDTVAAVLVLAYAGGASPHEAAELANAAGAVVVGKIGSVGITQEELVGMLRHEHD